MPKLVLKFDDRVLQECSIGAQGVKIGRLPDNTLVIDNPAVSSHHARVFREGGSYVLEDLKSTNGTFVNEKPVGRHTLRDGDVVLIGKHKIEFDLLAEAGEGTEVREPTAIVPDLGGTRLLDTEAHKTLLAKWEREAQAKKLAEQTAATARPAPSRAPEPATPAAAVHKPERHAPPARVGVLRVISGRADQEEYSLTGQTSIIGKADTALVRLKGWFKPKVALAIARKGEGYTATPLGGKTLLNGQRMRERDDLRNGDVLVVSGLTLEFRLK